MSRNSFIEQPIHRSPSFILNSIAILFLLDAGPGELPGECENGYTVMHRGFTQLRRDELGETGIKDA